MASQTDICNAAISHAGTRSKITSITEGSPEANACLTHYAMVLNATLRAVDWNFARITANLAQLPLYDTTDVPQRWAYTFTMPTDCVRIRRLNNVPLVLCPEMFFELAAAKDSIGQILPVIMCNVTPMKLIYTAKVEDPTRWDAGFTDAMTYGLASRVCYELNGKETKVNELLQMGQATLWTAASENGNEGSGLNRVQMPEALQARGYDDGLQEIGQVFSPDSWPG